jgi:putative endonuclease
MADTRSTIGKMGEDAACRYLMERGHALLERNWRSGHLEVDIITRAADGLHFVEVKSRVAPLMADPQDNVRRAKQQHIASAARRYIAALDGFDGEVWLDVVAVVFDGSKTEITYFPGAYTPIYT